MPIGSNTSNPTKDIFFTPRYKTLIRSLKEILIRNAQVLPIPNPNDRFAYRNDFYKLLRSLGIQPHMWWTVAYLNGVEDPTKDNSDKMDILNIDEESILRAISRSNTREG